jgi:hypothetical protein
MRRTTLTAAAALAAAAVLGAGPAAAVAWPHGSAPAAAESSGTPVAQVASVSVASVSVASVSVAPVAAASGAGAAASGAGAATSVVQRVVLTSAGPTTGATRTYVARVLDAAGGAITGADLDLGALGADPDDRVVTEPMVANPTDPAQYGATITFPSPGEWVLVVRVHAPSRYVHLGQESIDAGALPQSHDSPSRAALRAIAPDFNARYDPSTGIGATGTVPPRTEAAAAASDPHGAGASATSMSGGDRHDSGDLMTNVVVNLLHAGGAAAWVLGMLALVFAKRARPSTASAALVRLVADRYALLVGGGLTAVVVSGLINLERATPTGFDIGALLETGLGQAYFAVLAAKVALAASSIVLSAQIGSLLRSRQLDVGTLTLRSVGAAAQRSPRLERALRLADVNGVIAAAILICVVLLANIHRVIH